MRTAGSVSILYLDYQLFMKFFPENETFGGYLFRFPVLKGIKPTTKENPNMKKFVSFLAAATFVVALSSCGGNNAEEATSTETTTETEMEVTTETSVDTATGAVTTDTTSMSADTTVKTEMN